MLKTNSVFTSLVNKQKTFLINFSVYFNLISTHDDVCWGWDEMVAVGKTLIMLSCVGREGDTPHTSKTDSGSLTFSLQLLTLSLQLYETDSVAQIKLISLYMSDNLNPNLLSRNTNGKLLI